MEQRQFIVIDIETKPADNWRDFVKDFDVEEVKIGNLKDQSKIDAKIKQAMAIYWATAEKNAALSALTGEVVIIAIYDSRDNAVTILEGDESTIINQFWDIVLRAVADNMDIVGHNIDGFDIPFLTQRSWIKNIIPVATRQGRYLKSYFKDTMLIFLNYAYGKWTSLNDLAKVLGVGAKIVENSKNFYKLYERDRDKAIAHATNDVIINANVWRRLSQTRSDTSAINIDAFLETE